MKMLIELLKFLFGKDDVVEIWTRTPTKKYFLTFIEIS